jgi:AraC-like DNA-binding protein
MAKAFDSVTHERLLLKLERYGIGGNLLLWFRNFLTNRKQRVVIQGTPSEWSSVISGTPKGTILGPILFLLYINDVSDNVKSKIKLFADDTKIYREIKDPTIDTVILQSDLNSVSEWANKWKMHFNVSKCEVMRITHSRDKSVPNYHLEEMSLKVVHSVKDLGVNVSSDLSWNKHVGITINKANKVLGIIKRTVNWHTKPASFLYIV